MSVFRPDPWEELRRLTPARIALGSAGAALPTARHLDFQLAHARARDAVHRSLDYEALAGALAPTGVEVVRVHSAAPDRAAFLQRPDLGRQLDEAGRRALADRRVAAVDAVLVLADGLSAAAVESHAPAVLGALAPRLRETGWRLGPIVVVEEGRVAVGDEIGELLGCALAVVMIGERPGLTSPDSLGIYLTHAPRVGRTDAERNCISNVRPEGLPPAAAAHRLAWLMEEARRRRLTGVALRDEAPDPPEALPPG